MILVDSDILIAHLRGVAAARDWLLATRREAGRLTVSVVTVAEIAGGMRSSERHEVRRLFESMRVLDVNERAGWKAAEYWRTYRRSHSNIGLGDYLIAGTVAVAGLDLRTLNTRHFPMFPDLERPFELPA
ncbi:MAG: type II toxin-antitoxin system VapC family toxin [Sporichthyaceae bacterium]